MNYQGINELLKKAQTYYGRRIAAQLDFAAVLNSESENRYEQIVSQAVDYAYGEFKKDGAITKAAAKKTEELLEPLREVSKSYTVLCVAHAHIDMNWMWGYDETVNITLATFRTMLQLMREYPDFTFSQSQASCYKIVEEYDPEMLKEIRKRVKEGRWEVTATNWVELDKNMPNGEEQTRHILYTKKYLTKLLGIGEDTFTVDFEPDTFGHNANIPMILQKSGVKYLYHCRGNIAPALYHWKAENGDKILVFREPTCYNWDVKPNDFRHIPAFAKEYGIKKILRVYGVGDHGGGATRKDIELFKDMQTWPAAPTFKFSSYHEFFKSVEEAAPALKTLEGEQNFVFRGCYSTQSKLKAANRKNREEFFKTEQLQALLLKEGETPVSLEEAWRAHLFGHFHDIITGSGKEATRNYQMGKAQEVHARLAQVRTQQLIKLGKEIDTSAFQKKQNVKDSISFGAGVGYGNTLCAGNGAEGENRLFLVYNYGPESGKQVAEITIWDYEGLTKHLRFTDADGKELEFEILDAEPWPYWGHWARRALVSVDVAAYGYAVIALRADKNEMTPVEYPPIFQRREDVTDYVLENEYIRAEFDRNTTALIGLTDKESGKTYRGEALGCFRFIEEENSKGMTGWVTGNYSKTTDLLQGGRMIEGSLKKGGLKESFRAQAEFSQSVLDYTVSLAKGDRFLRIQCECNFYERGGKMIPQLNYRLKLGQGLRYRYDIPYGLLERKEEDGDVVANSFACADAGESALLLTTDTKYGYRANKGELSVVLLRASFDPDPYPEVGMHEFSIGIGFAKGSEAQLIRIASMFNRGAEVLAIAPGEGTRTMRGELLKIEGDAVLSSIKAAEDGNGRIVRLYNPTERDQSVKLWIDGKPVKMRLCTGTETMIGKEEEETVTIAKKDVVTVKTGEFSK